MRFRYSLLIIIGFLATVHQAMATHIRAGEIIAERISVQALTYRITVVGYTDTGSSVIFGPGEINFGDGRTEVLNTESEVSTVNPWATRSKNTPSLLSIPIKDQEITRFDFGNLTGMITR